MTGGECVDSDVVYGLHLVESRSGRRLRSGGRERSREQRHRKTTKCHDGICLMCIVFEDDTQKRRSYHWVITAERPVMLFSLE